VSVLLDGEEYTIPALPARAWVVAHLDDDPLAVFPGLLPDDDEDALLDAIDDDEDTLTHQRCIDVGLAVLSQASGGWRWWEADRLVAVAAANWAMLDGGTARRGVDLLALPLDRFLAAVYAWRIENATKEDREEFLRWLEAPPLTAYDAEDPDALEHEAESFLAVAGQLGAFGGG
jgi:hypothetical protein